FAIFCSYYFFFFVFVFCRLPSSTFFPYTTLFRSRNGFSSLMIDASQYPLVENIAYTKKVVEVAHAVGISVEAELGKIGGTEDDIDRKSTRLNSSHVSISYAVFCLKKKKKK